MKNHFCSIIGSAIPGAMNFRCEFVDYSVFWINDYEDPTSSAYTILSTTYSNSVKNFDEKFAKPIHMNL